MVFHETAEVPWTVEWDEIPWNSSAAKWTIIKFHRIPWNSIELWCRQMIYHSVPWNSIELWDCHFNQHHVTLDLHGVFYGTPWNFSRSKGKFNGIPWNFESSMELDANTKFHGIPWNSMETPDLEQKLHGIPWNFKKFHGIWLHNQIPWNHYNQ